jgi:transketolase
MAVLTTRRAVSEGLLKLMEQDESVVLVSSDSVGVIKAQDIVAKYPNRVIEVGIAEQLAVDTAAGLAASGMKPYYVTYAVFASMRSCEQVRSMVAYPHLNVTIIGANGGMGSGEREGVSHQCFEDIGIFRTFAGITIISPSDASQVEKAVIASSLIDGPVYIRTGSGKEPPLWDNDESFEIGKVIVRKEAKSNLTLFSHGFIMREVMKAVKELENEGIEVKVVEVPTIKPLPEDEIIKHSAEAKMIMVVEDHSIYGGLSSAIAELLSEKDPKKITRIALKDTFPESGSADELFSKYKMDCKAIKEKIKTILENL